MKNGIDYSALVDKAMIGVFKDVLKLVEKQGMPDEHMLYISFRTDNPKTVVSDALKKEYPEVMTIVLQHFFKNLVVESECFMVDLSFGGVIHHLSVPFSAVVSFHDPYANFGLAFSNLEEENINIKEETKDSLGILGTPNKKVKAEVLSFNKFKKKK